jgi:hypothetical protein
MASMTRPSTSPRSSRVAASRAIVTRLSFTTRAGRMAHYKIRKRLAKPRCHRRGFFPIDVKPIDRIQHFAAAVPIELSEQRDDLFDDGVGFRGRLRLDVVRLKVVFGLGFLSPTDRQRSLGAASLFRGSGQPAPGAARTFALIMAQGGGRSWESLRTLGAQGSHPIRNVDAAPRAYRSTPSEEVLFVLEARLRASRKLVSDALLVASNPDDKPLLLLQSGFLTSRLLRGSSRTMLPQNRSGHAGKEWCSSASLAT